MPINPNSRMRKTRKAIHGWKDGETFFTSLRPRDEKAPANQHASASEALREATRRHLPMVWDDPSVV